MKKIIQIDMDDTSADFKGHPEFKGITLDPVRVAAMYRPGFFAELAPVEGALSAIRALIRMGFDVQILTQPVAESAHSYSEKVQWIGMWLPELVNKINMTQDKGLVKGHFLIDDNAEKWEVKFSENGGKFVHFKYSLDKTVQKKEWARIVEYFEGISPSTAVKD